MCCSLSKYLASHELRVAHELGLRAGKSVTRTNKNKLWIFHSRALARLGPERLARRTGTTMEDIRELEIAGPSARPGPSGSVRQ